MYTSTHIRRHIFSLQLNTIFSTRALLNFGKSGCGRQMFI